MDKKEETKVENWNDRKQEWELDENAVFTPLLDQVGDSQRIWAAMSICWGGKFTLLTYLQLQKLSNMPDTSLCFGDSYMK